MPFDEYLKVDDEKQINKFVNELKQLYYSYAFNKINIEYELLNSEDNQNFVDIQFNINEGKISKINKINFIGNSYFKRSTLLDNIKSQQRNYLKLRFLNNFKYYVVENDIIRLRKLYLDSGFRDIKMNQKQNIWKQKINLIYFYINEGKLYTFNKFELKIGLTNISYKSN